MAIPHNPFTRQPGKMLTPFARNSAFLFTFVVLVLFSGSAFGKVERRYPCDPKFGYEGNYLEISTGSVASAQEIRVCFGSKAEPEEPREKHWWEFLKIPSGKLQERENRNAESCLPLASLPGRIQDASGNWTAWRKRVELDAVNTAYQFALCGSDEDSAVWDSFQRHLGVNAWDDMRIVASTPDEVMIEKLRVVQNRVRILDNESSEEGQVHFLLKGNPDGNGAIRLAERIRKTKLNRVRCLNVNTGAPYCEQAVPGLEENSDLPPVIQAALLELGHSGSKKYRRENNAYCSEFAFFVIEQGVHLSEVCRKNIPNPAREDVNVKDMLRWFKSCKRLIPREEIKDRIKPGDFISVDNLNHSAIFLGWSDPEKRSFWEISGNNRCQPERETTYAPKNKANMVCISQRDFEKYVLERDYAGIVGGVGPQ